MIWQSACACRRSLRWDQLFLVASSAFVVFGPLGKGGAGVGPSPPLVVHDGRESCCEATIKAINAKSLQRYMQSIKAALELAKPWATYHAQEAARQRALGVGDFCMAMADDGGDGGGGGGGGGGGEAVRAATTWSLAARRSLFLMKNPTDLGDSKHAFSRDDNESASVLADQRTRRNANSGSPV